MRLEYQTCNMLRSVVMLSGLANVPSMSVRRSSTMIYPPRLTKSKSPVTPYAPSIFRGVQKLCNPWLGVLPAANGTSASLTDGSLFAPYKKKISEINNQSGRLAKDKNRVPTIDGVGKKKDRPEYAEVPKHNGHHAFAGPLAGNPLNQESCGKDTLGSESQDQPESAHFPSLLCEASDGSRISGKTNLLCIHLTAPRSAKPTQRRF
jgi:hypothetical protein